jgi:hypothetical protein
MADLLPKRREASQLVSKEALAFGLVTMKR